MKLRAGTIHKAINPKTGRVISVKGAKEKAWKAFARFVRSRDPRCITCGAQTTEAGHFLHNSDKTNKKLGGNELWYSEENVNGQCGVCNRHHSGRGAIYGVRLTEIYGSEILPSLYLKFRTGKKWTIPELLSIADKYENL